MCRPRSTPSSGRTFSPMPNCSAIWRRAKPRPHCASLRLISPGQYLPTSRRRLANEVIIAAAGGSETMRLAHTSPGTRTRQGGGRHVHDAHVREIKNKLFELHRPCLPTRRFGPGIVSCCIEPSLIVASERCIGLRGARKKQRAVVGLLRWIKQLCGGSRRSDVTVWNPIGS
jgi:hypothetical protein